jgi:hypothetical protein
MRIRNVRGGSSAGTTLVMTLVCIGALSTMSVALLAVTLASSREQRATKDKIRAEYVAEAGLAAAVVARQSGGNGALGNVDAPVALGDSRYWVEVTEVNADLITLTSTGFDDRDGARLELTLRREIDSIWEWAAFGDDFTSLDSNARVDSYDSTLGTYASQFNGTFALENGNVGSNGNVMLNSNAHIWGDATPGPGGTTQVTGNAIVEGSTSPSPKPVDLPEIVLPSYAPLGPMVVNTTLVLGPGDYQYTDFLAKSNSIVTVTGPANFVFTNFIMRSNAQFRIDSTNGPVKMWVVDDFTLSSNTSLGPLNGKPSALEVNLLSDNVIDPEVIVDLDVIDLDSNAKMWGTIYAPNATIEVDSDFELFGSLVARSVDLDSNSVVHFDEALSEERADGEEYWERVAWRALPYTRP